MVVEVLSFQKVLSKSLFYRVTSLAKLIRIFESQHISVLSFLVSRLMFRLLEKMVNFTLMMDVELLLWSFIINFAVVFYRYFL